jgi:uncharacterized membrane protein
MSRSHFQEHVDLIAKQEEEFIARRTPAERVGDAIAAFAGSLTFVLLHLLFVGSWVAINTLSVAGIHHFDPLPYSLLGTVLAFEAILLAAFILMRQSRTNRRSEERDHLMLQILLLTEKEITAVVGMDRQIAQGMGLHHLAKDMEIEQLSQDTSIDEMARTIQEALPTE